MTAYEAIGSYSYGYKPDFAANTHNSENTYVFQADTTEFDTNASVNSNGEIESNPPSELTVNAAASKSILRNKQQMRLKQFSSTPIDATDGFYKMEGDIIDLKNDIDENSIISDSSITSSGTRRRSYQSRTRKEKQKKRHGPNGKTIK